MSIPTFYSTALVTRAARDMPRCPQVRLRAETLPGVNGQYVQLHGTGGREIVVRGVLEADGATPALAHQDLKASLRSKQALADGARVADYIGADGATYAHCVLTSYEAVGEVQVSPAESGYRALLFVEAKIRQLTP